MIWLVLVACGGGAPPTVVLPVTASGTAGAAFDEGGVAVVLTEASVTFRDLRMEAPAETARLRLPSLFPVAYAHPGHDFSGDVEGELLGDFTVDLLAAPMALGDATLYAGPFETARLDLAAATLAGTATPTDGAATPFRFEIAFEDEEITGIAFVADIAEDDDRALALGIDAAWMLSFCDLATPPGDDATLALADGSLANTVPFGVTSTPAWTLSPED